MCIRDRTEENKNSTVEETVIGQENTEEEINNEVQQEKGTESDEAFPDEESVGNSDVYKRQIIDFGDN